MYKYRPIIAATMAAMMMTPASFGASHREAPITALDHKADITDVFAFVSYDDSNKVTMLMNVDPLLEPSNGPNYFPFDPDILYAIRVDNNNDAVEDIVFEVRFQTEIRAPRLFTGFAGKDSGVNAPANAPLPALPNPIIPPAITALDGPGSAGLSLRQTYTVTMVKGNTRTDIVNSNGGSFFAVPSNVGPRTMPNYPALAAQGIYNSTNGIRTFAGTVDDPFYIDVGAAFDTFNFRAGAGGGVLSPAQDSADGINTAADAISGFNVNTIAIEVPIAMLTRTGTKVEATNAAATIGVFGTTSRQRVLVRRAPLTSAASGSFSQVQRMGNALFNELLIGTGFKDTWSMSQPSADAQFASFALDPLIARVLNALFLFPIPPPQRTDLLLLVQYAPPIAAAGTPAGPVADLLRLNTGVPPTTAGNRRRLGVLGGDNAGYPNGRRVSDDVTDISLRVVAGVLIPAFNVAPNNRLGDGVNTNDKPYQETFPYVAFANSGRDRRHIDPGETGCGGGTCPVQ